MMQAWRTSAPQHALGRDGFPVYPCGYAAAVRTTSVHSQPQSQAVSTR